MVGGCCLHYRGFAGVGGGAVRLPGHDPTNTFVMAVFRVGTALRSKPPAPQGV